MLHEIRPAIVFIIGLTLITGLAYPLAITGLAQILFPYQARGSLIESNGQVVGLALLGQLFTADTHFHARPSPANIPDPNDATKTVDAPYNAAYSGGSNLGPTNRVLRDRVRGDLDKLRAENATAPVPIDLVTTSGSGLDPHITPAAAFFQVPRAAKTRNMFELSLRQLVTASIEERTLGLLGEPRVNVLTLNFALIRAAAR